MSEHKVVTLVKKYRVLMLNYEIFKVNKNETMLKESFFELNNFLKEYFQLIQDKISFIEKYKLELFIRDLTTYVLNVGPEEDLGNKEQNDGFNIDPEEDLGYQQTDVLNVDPDRDLRNIEQNDVLNVDPEENFGNREKQNEVLNIDPEIELENREQNETAISLLGNSKEIDKSLKQVNVNTQELRAALENSSVIEFIEPGQNRGENLNQPKSPTNIVSLQNQLRNNNEPASQENIDTVQNNCLSRNTNFEENSVRRVAEEPVKYTRRWRNPLPQYKSSFIPLEEDEINLNAIIFRKSVNLGQSQVNNIINYISNTDFKYEREDFSSRISILFEKVRNIENNLALPNIMPPDPFDHINITNHRTVDFNSYHQLTETWNQNLRLGDERQNTDQITTVNNIVASASNTGIAQNLNLLNFQDITPVNRSEEELLQGLPSNIVEELNIALPIDNIEMARDLDDSNKLRNISKHSFLRKYQSLEIPRSLQLGIQETITSIDICRNINQTSVSFGEIGIQQTIINELTVIPPEEFYKSKLRQPRLQPPEPFQNWLNFLEINDRAIYYETPVKKRRLRKPKRNKTNDHDTNNYNNTPNELPNENELISNYQLPHVIPNAENVDVLNFQETGQLNNSEERKIRFLTKFKSFQSIFLKFSPQNYSTLTKFETNSISSMDYIDEFKNIYKYFKDLILVNTKHSTNQQRLSDNEIVQMFNASDPKEISQTCLGVTKYLENRNKRRKKCNLIANKVEKCESQTHKLQVHSQRCTTFKIIKTDENECIQNITERTRLLLSPISSKKFYGN